MLKSWSNNRIGLTSLILKKLGAGFEGEALFETFFSRQRKLGEFVRVGNNSTTDWEARSGRECVALSCGFFFQLLG
jgi:hypothetical protein